MPSINGFSDNKNEQQPKIQSRQGIIFGGSLKWREKGEDKERRKIDDKVIRLINKKRERERKGEREREREVRGVGK